MTTAELLKKREEERNKPLLEDTKPSFTSMTEKPDPNNIEGMKAGMSNAERGELVKDYHYAKETERNMDAAALDPNAVKVSEAGKEALMERPKEGVSLYDIGKSFQGSANKAMATANTSPLKTPEYDDFRKQVIGEKHFGVESEEDAAKRERRDYIRQGLTGLTEGLSALANLYYTTKWAPNQKLVSQMPALQQRLYQERMERDKKLENFRKWQRGQAEKDADRAFQERLLNKRQEAEAKKEEREWAYRTKQAEENLRRWEAEFKAAQERHASDAELKKIQLQMQQAQQEFDNNLKKQQLAETIRHNKTTEYNTSVRNGTSGTGGKKNTKMAVIKTPKGAMDVDYGRINETTLNQLYNSVPEDIKAQYATDVLDDEKTKQDKQRKAIDHALQESQGFADWFEIAGLGTYQNKDQGNTAGGKVDYSKYKTGQTNAGTAQQTTAQSEPPVYTPTMSQEQIDAATPKDGQTNASVTETQTPGTQFDAFFNKTQKEQADKANEQERKMQTKIAEKESEIKQTRDTLNAYNAELDQLMKMKIPHVENERKKRGLNPSQTRELQSLVNDTVKRKEFLKKNIKELEAKEKILNKEYEKLYPYKKVQ